eukprot:5037365-Amphidinium_carterae.1
MQPWRVSCIVVKNIGTGVINVHLGLLSDRLLAPAMHECAHLSLRLTPHGIQPDVITTTLKSTWQQSHLNWTI